MNLKTTLALIVLLGAGAGAWIGFASRKTEESTSPTALFLEQTIVADKITRIEATRGKESRYSLEKNGSDWYLSGNWPARRQETEQLLATLASLRSRFTPIVLADNADLKPYGLDENPLTIKVTVGDAMHTLRFGEEAVDSNRFTRATHVRLDDKPEVIRLGPGVLAALDRQAEYFRQQRLFPYERVAKDDDGKEKVEQLTAVEIDVETPNSKFTMAKKENDWILKEASTKKDKDWKRLCSEDRIDPAKRDALLRGFPDLWADKFVDAKAKSLDETGLKDPAYIVSAKNASGAKVKLLIGKVSSSKSRIAKGPTPPGQFGQPPKQPEIVTEEYRYAKLDKNEQIFEMKADKLRDIGVDVEDLRDPLLARFKTEDVKRLEIQRADQTLVFVRARDADKGDEKGKEKWRLEKPNQDVEAAVVEELLEKLAGLRASERDVLDDGDLKAYGLAKPAAQITITVEETDKIAKKSAVAKEEKKKSRAIVLHLGLKKDSTEKDKDKLYVRVDAWPRINQLGDEVWKLSQRSELAYRPRELWKLDHDAITKITIDAEAKPYHLVRGEKGWKITGPLDADATGDSMDKLADELTRLKVERFESNHSKDLKSFGLDKPAFKLEIATKEGKPKGLEIGSRVESKEGGRFARLAGGDTVFVLSEKLTSHLRKDPFELLDASLLAVNPAEIERIRYQGTGTGFTLDGKAGRWRVIDSPAGELAADEEMLKLALAPWSKLQADRYVAVGPKTDFASYGLAKPFLVIRLTVKANEKDLEKEKGKVKEKDKKPVEHLIELGNEDKAGGRFARINQKDAVVLLDALTTNRLTRTHLDFLDPRVLRFDADAVMLIERKMKDADLELARREDNWQIAKPALRDGDNLTIFDLLRQTSALRVNRIAEFPAKDLAKYGLDKPAAMVTFQLEIDGAGKKHVIKLGDAVKDAEKKDTGERFAQIDDKAMVVVLSAELSRHLLAPALYFAERNLASFASADKLEMTRGTRKAIFSRADKGWEMSQPISAAADGKKVEELLRLVQRLRADEVVADKPVDLKKYGLDQPAAQWRFKSGTDDKLHLIVGAPENDKPGARRYGKIGDKNTVFLLSRNLSSLALLEFRDTAVLPSFEVGKATGLAVTIGTDKPFAFEKKDNKWQQAGDPKQPVNGEAVEDTLRRLASFAADEFVVDAKADLKQFGLAPPGVKVEVTLVVGKREIWLGSVKDKGKSRFAVVPGADGVFVIDDIHGAMFSRPRSAYLEAEKKK